MGNGNDSDTDATVILTEEELKKIHGDDGKSAESEQGDEDKQEQD